jgi:hypothetical protein
MDKFKVWVLFTGDKNKLADVYKNKAIFFLLERNESFKNMIALVANIFNNELNYHSCLC